MKKNNPLIDKSFAFAIKATKCCLEIREYHKEYDLSRQLIRSSTSIGANVEEAIGGQSSKDFFHKLNLSYKEARESHYWIRTLNELDMISNNGKDELLNDVEEIQRIIGSIQTTMRRKFNYKFNK